MIKRKYVVLSLLTLVSVMFGSLLYSSLVSAQSSTVTGYISVSAAAFVPKNNTQNVLIESRRLTNWETTVPFARFYGSVQFPHGATLTNFTFYWYVNVPDTYIGCELRRYNQTNIQAMVGITSGFPSGYGSSYDDTIEYATVDNSKYAYRLMVTIPNSTSPNIVYFQYAVIEYTLPAEAAVGGLYIPVDKLSLYAPYIALVSTIILAVSISVAYIKHRKKQ